MHWKYLAKKCGCLTQSVYCFAEDENKKDKNDFDCYVLIIINTTTATTTTSYYYYYYYYYRF